MDIWRILFKLGYLGSCKRNTQNQLDGITEKIGKKNILIEGKKTKNNEESTDYTFFNNSNGEIIGEIKYNEEQKT